MRITCPHCGPRGADEFLYTQDGSLRRPENDDAHAWVDYVYLRDNLKGPRQEF